jgi:hypothetical protein
MKFLNIFLCIKFSVLSILTLTPLFYGILNPELRQISNNSELFGEKIYKPDEYFFCQPANGWSSLMFIIPCFTSLRNLKMIKSQYNLEILLFIVCNYLNYIGNLSYHTFCIKNGMYYDSLGMISILSFLISKTFQKTFYKLKKIYKIYMFWIVFCISVIICNPFILYITHAQRIYEFVIPVIIFVELTYANIKEDSLLSNKYGTIACINFFIGYILWDIQRENDPTSLDSWLQLHSLWHMFCTICLVFLSLMYKKQRKNEIIFN